MRTVLTLAFTILTTLTVLGPVHAQGVGESIRRFREAAQFDRARAGEFNKLANEDQGVAQARERQAQDLDNNAIKYSQRANWHRQIAAQYGGNPDQLRLARECDEMASSMHNMANERRSITRTLVAHIANWRAWANNLNARAASEDAAANQLQSAGNL